MGGSRRAGPGPKSWWPRAGPCGGRGVGGPRGCARREAGGLPLGPTGCRSPPAPAGAKPGAREGVTLQAAFPAGPQTVLSWKPRPPEPFKWFPRGLESALWSGRGRPSLCLVSALFRVRSLSQSCSHFPVCSRRVIFFVAGGNATATH